MTAEKLINILKEKESFTNQTVSEFKQLTEKYPYFTAVKVLYLKNLYCTKDVVYSAVLKSTAIQVNDRLSLYNYILAPDSKSKDEEPVDIVLNVESSDLKDASRTKKAKTKELSHLDKEILLQAISSTVLLEADREMRKEKNENVEHEHNIAKNYNEDEKKNFYDWLISIDGNGVSSKKKQSIDELVDRFITNEPKINSRNSFFSPSKFAKKSIEDSGDFATETLASLYVKQGNYQKAIAAYKNLSLKYPEKKDTFASLISDLEKKVKEK